MADLNIYLIAKYTGVPKDPRQTAKSGYVTDPDNIHYDEQVYISRGLRDRDLQNGIVLNLTEQKTVKNIFKPGKKFDELFEYFYNGYANYIDDCVNQLNG